jgi:hypothetical protein
MTEDIGTILTDDDFKSEFDPVIVPAGKYRVKLLPGKPRVKVSKAGNRYLNVRLVAMENEAGEFVNSKVIYHTVSVEGVGKTKDGKDFPLRRMFVGFMKAVGLDEETIKSVYTSLLEDLPAVSEIGDKTEIQLRVGSEPLSLANRQLMASIKEETYTSKEGQEVEANRIGSLWAAKGDAGLPF